MSNAILGIDVGKAEIAVALLIDNNSAKKEIFNNNDKEFKSLNKWLKQKKVSTLKACMEARFSNCVIKTICFP